MKIGFYSTGKGSHVDMAKGMIASVKRHMPDIPLFHLTDGDTEALGEPIRLAEPKPLALNRITHYSRLIGDWLLVDTDIIFNRDVREVFNQPFDVAFAERDEKNDYCTAMPYNLGVVFSRNWQFWADIVPAVQGLPPKLQEWEGGQLASGWYATRDWCPYKILKLPAEYNYCPKSKDEDVSGKAIVHYKGRRPKRWLQEQTQSP